MGEINDDDWRNDLDISGLSLMEEDDSLLLFPDHTSGSDKEERGLDWFGDNLRKSLAWDKAFFTNAGVLEPDELCHMIESNHVLGEKRVLATIQEDVKRSTESISSTLKSDCCSTVETSHQDRVLFEDVVTASSQRSPPAVSTHIRASTHSPTPSTLDSHAKVKPNVAIHKRPSIRAQGLGKVTNKPVAAKEHNTSMSRPSTGLISKSVRASVDVNKTKQGESLTISRRVRSIVSKPALRSSSSVASKNELLTSSCSSLESCISASSSSASKKSVLKQKKASNSLVTTSRAASRLIGQSRVSPLSASSTYKPRLPSSNASAFLSASVDWSFNSPMRASTPNKMGKGKKKTVSGGSSLAIDQQGTKHSSVVNGATTLSSDSVTKPTGLRVPSPKLGYFDGGARSSVARTPTGSCTGPVSGSAKHGGRSLNESTTSSRTKSRLIQESTKGGRPVSRSSRLIVSASSASSPKITTNKKTYSKVSAEEQLNGDAGGR